MAIEVHIFDTEKRARVWAGGKNALSRKYRWVVRKRATGGWGAYKVKR